MSLIRHLHTFGILAALLSVDGVTLAAEDPAPVPRHPDGSVIISGEPGDYVGLWVPADVAPDYDGDNRIRGNLIMAYAHVAHD